MWQGLFLISIAQAVFLLSLMMVRIKEKTMDFFLVSLLLVALAVTNADFFFISSGVYTSFPYAFGSSFGLMLLFGPIFYLYAQGTIHSEYRWRPSVLFHFVPYGVNLLLNIPIYLTASPQKIQFINELVARPLSASKNLILKFSCLVTVEYRLTKSI